MADDAPPPLSLKVMRVSRPQLAATWHPFYSSSPAFSAHSTASITSLQGRAPLPGHPKTLRDLSHPADLLTLPSSFGAIQLGETFSSSLCVNNEAAVEIDAISLRVDIQTANSKFLLAEFGGPQHKLQPKDTMECLVTHEIKELGQHVLACSVTYRPPPGHRPPPGGPRDHPDDPTLQTFRKFYKFAVTNPLSVKTKVHTPISPSALLSPTERDKVLLEVHIQNLTPEPMHFEKMHFDCADGWTVQDANTITTADGPAQSLFSGSLSLMQPQDTRQYIYVLAPSPLPLIPLIHAPGNVIPLGRLDISWRSSFGEPGRLLTSMLSRRIPLLPPTQPPASALPPYLKRTIPGIPSRPQSPQLFQSRPGSPAPHQRPQSPQTFVPQLPVIPDVDVNLVTRNHVKQPIRVDEPFTIPFKLILSYTIPPHHSHQQRILSLVVQHLQTPPVTAPPFILPLSQPPAAPVLPQDIPIPISRPTSSGFSTPSSATGVFPFNYPLAHQKLVAVASPRQPPPPQEIRVGSTENVILPPPYFEGSDELRSRSNKVTYVGSSILQLPEIEIPPPTQPGEQLAVTTHEFELTYLPLRKGFTTVGGLRVLLVEDSFIPDAQLLLEPKPRKARTLKEWEVISEIWVGP